MSMIPIEQLVTAPTSDEVFEKLLDALELVQIPARSWREGGVARSILGVCAELGAQGAAIVTSCVRGGFLLFAQGVYLTAHAKDVYDVDRIVATYAAGEVTLTNTGGAIHEFGADEVVIRSSNTGARYRVTEEFILGSGSPESPTTLTVAVSAIEPGSDSSVAPGELDEFETSLASVTVTNEAGIVGADAETDAKLVARCIAKKGTWSPFGPRDAYEYAALSALLPSGDPTSISRVSVSRYSSTGIVTVICATPSGTPSDDELEAATDNVELIARADTATAIVSGAVPKETTKSIRIWCRGGTESIILDNAEAALAALIADYPIGGIAKTDGGQGYLYDDAIAAAVIGSSPEVFDIDFTAGGGDVELDADEVATNTTTFEVRIR